MRRFFLIATVLASFLAILLGVARYEARYSSKLALRDLAHLRVPGYYLASSVDEANIAPALTSYLESAKPSSDPAEALSIIEMHAAGVFTAKPDPAAVSVQYQELLKAWPNSPLIHYRYAAYLLTRLQLMARERPGQKFLTISDSADRLSEAEDVTWEARRELTRAAALDQQNSLLYYEMAYSYLIFGDREKASEWLRRGMDATEYDSGDDVVIRGAAKVATAARLPNLESFIAAHKVAQFAPSFAAGRIEALSSELMSERTARDLALKGASYRQHLAAFEDLSEKLLQTASVLRQTQSSFVISGVLWRKVAGEATALGDPGMRDVARKQLAAVSYRYLLVGWLRAQGGLMPQQSVIELDTPVDLRLPFSVRAQDISRLLLLAAVVFLLPAVVVSLITIKVKGLRDLARALVVLVVFAGLGYSASFYSVLRERSTAAASLERRLRVMYHSPEFVRKNGQPSAPGDFRADISKEMLFTYDYTLQAGRVLAYIGTQDCYDTLISSLSSPKLSRPADVLIALEEATGEDFGRGASSPGKPGTAEAIRAWKEWWQDNRSRFPAALTRTPEPGAPRGA